MHRKDTLKSLGFSGNPQTPLSFKSPANYFCLGPAQTLRLHLFGGGLGKTDAISKSRCESLLHSTPFTFLFLPDQPGAPSFPNFSWEKYKNKFVCLFRTNFSCMLGKQHTKNLDTNLRTIRSRLQLRSRLGKDRKALKDLVNCPGTGLCRNSEIFLKNETRGNS